MITPNILQQESLQALKESKAKGNNKFLVVIPSGSGKTYLSAFETFGFKGRILYLVHRVEILNQAINSFKEIHKLKDEDIGYAFEHKRKLDGKIVFATIQTLSIKKNLNKIDPKHFDYIIIDEFHHTKSPSYNLILNYFKPKFLLGLTATPYRSDNQDILPNINNNVVYETSLKEGIEKNILVPFIYHGLYDNVDYSNIKFKGYKYSEKDLNKTLLINKRDKQIIKEFKKKIGKKQSLGFCCSVKHAKRCAKKFNKAGINAIAITYKDRYWIRKQRIEEFKRKQYQIIFTVDIFNEGIDFPEVEGLLFLRPTFSKTIFFQQLGRGLRTKYGKENVIVLDFIGNYCNAFMIKVWLHEWNVGKGKEELKPNYYYNIPQVYFDDKVIDLFKEQENKIITKEKVIEDYFNVKKKLNKNPTYREFIINNKTNQSFKNYFKTWNSFLKSINEKLIFNTTNSKKELIKNFYYLEKKLKRQPITKDIYKTKGSKYSLRSYKNVFGNWNNFLKSINRKSKNGSDKK